MFLPTLYQFPPAGYSEPVTTTGTPATTATTATVTTTAQPATTTASATTAAVTTTASLTTTGTEIEPGLSLALTHHTALPLPPFSPSPLTRDFSLKFPCCIYFVFHHHRCH